jgi:hypothetical protein
LLNKQAEKVPKVQAFGTNYIMLKDSLNIFLILFNEIKQNAYS